MRARSQVAGEAHEPVRFGIAAATRAERDGVRAVQRVQRQHFERLHGDEIPTRKIHQRSRHRV